MLVVDAHLDLSWNALQWNRNLLHSVYTIRTREIGMPEKARALNTVALPEMRQGRVFLCFATLLSRSTGNPVAHVDFLSPAQAFGTARGQLAYYRALESQGPIRILTSLDALDAHVDAWQVWETEGASGEPPPLGFVISMESADPILHPDDLADWHAAGVRLIGPAHYGMGRYAGGTSVEEGLTDTGFRLLDEMARVGVILDLTHLSDAAFWQALDRYDGPVIASHNNCRALVPHQRQYSDEQIRAIIARDGVIGAAFDAWMLLPGWVRGMTTNESVTLERVVNHIDHICQLAGNSAHVGIGSDLDGGFGREQSPSDLDTIVDLQKIAEILLSRGYADADVAAIMHGNWIRLLRRAWGGAS
ncbi:MAG: membrane dipeptidase [Anaerolineae bacterium]|nr:membrane dipeptidase [Anaerolineae bacterium]